MFTVNISGLENREYGRGDPLYWPRDTPYPQKLALTSPTSGGRSIGVVRLRTEATEFVFTVNINLVWIGGLTGYRLGYVSILGSIGCGDGIFFFHLLAASGARPAFCPVCNEGCTLALKAAGVETNRYAFTSTPQFIFLMWCLKGDEQLCISIRFQVW
jgi:hypothetical protein